MNKRRLLKLADFVETIPREEFSMSVYGSHRCGTVGCALGWATTKSLFRNLVPVNEVSWAPKYRGSVGNAAAAWFFDLSGDEAEALFTGAAAHRTPKQVARNIRRFVATGELP